MTTTATATPGYSPLKLRLEYDHYTNDTTGDTKHEYDFAITSSPFKVALTEVMGVFCMVSFVGEWETGGWGSSEKDRKNSKFWAKAINRLIERDSRNTGLSSEELHAKYVEFSIEYKWLHDFSTTDWDANAKIFKEDAECRKRFKAATTLWWKVVCDFITQKVASNTYTEWVALKREQVGEFLEAGVEKGDFGEGKYNASYKNYKTAYDVIQMCAGYCDGLFNAWAARATLYMEEKEEKGVSLPRNWAINTFGASQKSMTIYDRDDCFHFIITSHFNTILTENLVGTPSTPVIKHLAPQ